MSWRVRVDDSSTASPPKRLPINCLLCGKGNLVVCSGETGQYLLKDHNKHHHEGQPDTIYLTCVQHIKNDFALSMPQSNQGYRT